MASPYKSYSHIGTHSPKTDHAKLHVHSPISVAFDILWSPPGRRDPLSSYRDAFAGCRLTKRVLRGLEHLGRTSDLAALRLVAKRYSVAFKHGPKDRTGRPFSTGLG